jgi:hypothetical protein
MSRARKFHGEPKKNVHSQQKSAAQQREMLRNLLGEDMDADIFEPRASIGVKPDPAKFAAIDFAGGLRSFFKGGALVRVGEQEIKQWAEDQVDTLLKKRDEIKNYFQVASEKAPQVFGSRATGEAVARLVSYAQECYRDTGGLPKDQKEIQRRACEGLLQGEFPNAVPRARLL